MAIPKAKKQKKSGVKKPTKTPFDYIINANYLWLAVDVRACYTVENMSYEEIDEHVLSRILLLEEVQDGRVTIDKFMRETQEMTGYNVKEAVDRLFRTGRWGKQ